MNQDKLIQRIKKLFALANNNPNKNESSLAMSAAKKLLDKHNLSMIELEEKDNPVGVKFEDNTNSPWIRIIYASICKLYNCQYLIDKNYKPIKHVLIGTESNRVTASIVSDYVISEIKNEFRGKGAALRNSAAIGVNEKVNEIMVKYEEECHGTDLVPVDVEKSRVENWINENIKGLRQSKSNYKSNYKTDRNGESFGKNINLNAQISNKRAIGFSN